MASRLKIDLSQGLLEVEGTEAFVRALTDGLVGSLAITLCLVPIGLQRCILSSSEDSGSINAELSCDACVRFVLGICQLVDDELLLPSGLSVFVLCCHCCL